MEPFLQSSCPACAWALLSSKSSHLLLMQHDCCLLLLWKGKRIIILAILYWKSCRTVFTPQQPMHRHNYISLCYWRAMASPASAIPTLLLYFLDNKIFFFPFPCSSASSVIYSPDRLLQLQEDLGVISSLLSDTVGYQINSNRKPQDYAKSPFTRSHT